jgi:hypothetical protein
MRSPLWADLHKKPEQRLVADRSGLRYPSDLTDSEWAIVARRLFPFMLAFGSSAARGLVDFQTYDAEQAFLPGVEHARS